MHAIPLSVFLIFPIYSHSVENRTLLGGQMACEKRVFLTNRATGLMSAIGPKQTCDLAPHMSAFGGKADMTVCGNPLSATLISSCAARQEDLRKRTPILLAERQATWQLHFVAS